MQKTILSTAVLKCGFGRLPEFATLYLRRDCDIIVVVHARNHVKGLNLPRLQVLGLPFRKLIDPDAECPEASCGDTHVNLQRHGNHPGRQLPVVFQDP